jgi:hypothetical protein
MHKFALSLVMILIAPLAMFATASDSRPGEIQLQSELKVSGPAVFIRPALGYRYRPGFAYPLEVRVQNTGAEFRGVITISEGENGTHCGIFEPVVFPTQSSRLLNFPIRAPGVAANVTLRVRETDASGGTGPLRFQANLARVIKPLAPEARLTLVCGGGRGSSIFATLPDSVQLKPNEMLDEFWMYESVDLVVLGDASIKEASPVAKESLRRWVMGGGKLFIATTDALNSAISARLLPIDPSASGGVVEANRLWWEKNAGLSTDDVLVEKNNRPVYARLKLGFGVIVFVFPGTRTEDATESGAQTLNHQSLQMSREKFPDLRVQPDRYGGFAFGSVSSAQREKTLLWLGLGAVVFCIGLALGYTSRSRIVAAGWPLTIGVLLTVMLSRWFPPQELSVSRVEIAKHSADGSTIVRQEWALLQAFQHPQEISVSAPPDGTLLPLYVSPDELKTAGAEFFGTGNRLRLQELLVAPQQSQLLSGTVVELRDAAKPETWQTADGAVKLNFSMPADWAGKLEVAVLARPDRSLWVLDFAQGNVPRGTFALRKFEDWGALLKGGDPAHAKARTAALGWAVRDALGSGLDTVLLWHEVPADSGKDLLEIDAGRLDSGRKFQIWALQSRK